MNGGGCTSVGIGGCTLGGCFGYFSQKLGPSASNLLQAKIVLANGSLVTASSCRNLAGTQIYFGHSVAGVHGVPEIYLGSVVTEFTMRVYKSPTYITQVEYSGAIEAGAPRDWQRVAEGCSGSIEDC